MYCKYFIVNGLGIFLNIPNTHYGQTQSKLPQRLRVFSHSSLISKKKNYEVL